MISYWGVEHGFDISKALEDDEEREVPEEETPQEQEGEESEVNGAGAELDRLLGVKDKKDKDKKKKELKARKKEPVEGEEAPEEPEGDPFIKKRAPRGLARTLRPKHLKEATVNVGAGGPKGSVFREQYQRGRGNSFRSSHRATKTTTSHPITGNTKTSTVYHPAGLTQKGRKARNISAAAAGTGAYGGLVVASGRGSDKNRKKS